jgi:predicted phosphodiesterase
VIQLHLMRVLLISDIHANLSALNTVLESAGDYDTVWCLGDVVGYGPAPNECIERLRELEPLCVAGNHDWAALGRLNVEDFNPKARHAILWTRDILKPANREWLAQKPGSITLPSDDIVLVHGSPRNPIWEYILSTTTAAMNLAYLNASVCFFGHTHIPILYQQSGLGGGTNARQLLEDESLMLENKILLNPGSVGQPRDGDPRAAFALLDLATRTLTYHRIAYDIAVTQQAMAKVNLPRRLIDRLSYGL